MIKETIKYVDYNGEQREEDFYFNLSRAEIISMDYAVEGGLREMIEKIVKEKDTVKIYKMFTDIIYKAYGEKSPDGKRFVKSKEISESFIQTEAYSELIMKMISEPDYAAKFIEGVISVNTNTGAQKLAVATV